MANSAMNYHLLARHAVVIGYLPETEPLNRACFERMTRCAVFQLNKDLANVLGISTVDETNVDESHSHSLRVSPEKANWKAIEGELGVTKKSFGKSNKFC